MVYPPLIPLTLKSASATKAALIQYLIFTMHDVPFSSAFNFDMFTTYIIFDFDRMIGVVGILHLTLFKFISED